MGIHQHTWVYMDIHGYTWTYMYTWVYMDIGYTWTYMLGIDYRQRISNDSVRAMLTAKIGRHQELLEIVKTRKLKWFGHTTRSDGLAKTCLQGTVRGGRGRGRPRKKWSDNITYLTGLSFAEATWAAGCRDGWNGLVREAASSAGPQQRRAALREQ